ncbi:Uu.00g020620.m01.CDS01 [Anthostomella pinea]|uniref:Uu.00g020620.m01.CDS01 n=1 Tax=Anthostomella pinea TaxID=933095 RepID=A0AAI8VZI7_9PEZI|nr:Uu.00g020620.m01.CDS01 [Anthostomella pinea]
MEDSASDESCLADDEPSHPHSAIAEPHLRNDEHEHFHPGSAINETHLRDNELDHFRPQSPNDEDNLAAIAVNPTWVWALEELAEALRLLKKREVAMEDYNDFESMSSTNGFKRLLVQLQSFTDEDIQNIDVQWAKEIVEKLDGYLALIENNNALFDSLCGLQDAVHDEEAHWLSDDTSTA